MAVRRGLPAAACLLGAGLLIPAAAQQTATAARIHGRVVVSDTGAPVRSATVRLAAEQSTLQHGAPFPDIPTFVTFTSEDGRFDLRELPMGSYSLQVSKSGFAPAFFSPVPTTPQAFELKGGDQINLGDVRLARAGVIVGRIHDTLGDFFTDVSVTAWRVEFVEPARRRLRFVASVNSNDLGEFRLHSLRPGKYYVSAGRPPTFFPGTGSVQEALPVEVRAGAETMGTSISVLNVSVGSISGTLTDSRGDPHDRALVWLVQARSNGELVTTADRSATSDRIGRFTIGDLNPGDYRLEVSLPSGEVASVPLTVGSGRTEDVAVQTSPGFRARGRVLIDGAPVAASLATTIRIVGHASSDAGSSSGTTGGAAASVERDGSFVLSGAFGGRILRVEGLPPGAALHRVMIDGRDVTDSGFRLGGAEIDGLEVHATTRPARLEGEVRDAAGAPVKNAHVVIFSPDRAAWMQVFTRRFRITQAGGDGTFGEIGLPAGPYLAAVVADEDRDVCADPDYIERVRSRATPFTLADGATTKVVLQIAGSGELSHARK